MIFPTVHPALRNKSVLNIGKFNVFKMYFNWIVLFKQIQGSAISISYFTLTAYKSSILRTEAEDLVELSSATELLLKHH